MVSSDGSNDDKLQEYLVISVTLPSDNTTTGQQLVEYGETMQLVGLGLQVTGVAIVLLSGGTLAPVGVVFIKVGGYASAAGSVLEVTGYVLDKKYTDATISAMSAAISVGISKGAKEVYKTVKNAALSDLPSNLRQIVRVSVSDAPRLGTDQSKSTIMSYYYQDLYNAIAEVMDPANRMCVMSEEYIELYKTMQVLPNNSKVEGDEMGTDNQQKSSGSMSTNNSVASPESSQNSSNNKWQN